MADGIRRERAVTFTAGAPGVAGLWRPMSPKPKIGQWAVLLFDDAPRVALAVWRGRCRFSFNGWWNEGDLASLPVRREPIRWMPFEVPA